MDIVLDTDVASLIHKGLLPAPFAERLRPAAAVISFVTIGEMTKWAETRDWGLRRRGALDGWIARRSVIWCDYPVARLWGRLAAEAERRGRPQSDNDTWIAACCLAQGLPLATRNVKHYEDFAQHHGLELVTG